MEYPIIYLYIHKKLVDSYGVYTYIEKKKLYTIVGRCYHIPKNLFPIFLKEMEKMDLLIKADYKNLQIQPIKIDPEKKLANIYSEFGIF